MGWASPYIQRLQAGETVSFRPRGHSMSPRIRSGQLCTVSPLAATDAIAVNDVVLCKVRGQEYLHRVTAVDGLRYLIGNQRGGTNGWIGRSGLFGRLISVE